MLFNETFAAVDGATNDKSHAVLWHEGDPGRKPCDVALSNTSYIMQAVRDAKHVILFADNCASQNKNWTLYSSLIRLVNDDCIAANKITIKYLESGHTFMSADSVHGNIGKAIKSKQNIYDLMDYVSVIKNSWKNLETILLQNGDNGLVCFENESL